VKVEGRKPNLFEFYAKTYPIFYKDSERRVQRQTKTEFSGLLLPPVFLLHFLNCDILK